MILTKHLYISKYPINQSSKSLILGTIHPHNDINNTSNFKIDFFMVIRIHYKFLKQKNKIRYI